jgi:lysophospholipase L1-like esterase
VALIGDSYIVGIAGSPALQPALAMRVKDAASYPNYAGAGCSLATGGLCLGSYGDVPAQLSAARAAQPNLELIVMDGGANDILVCDSARFPGCADTCNSPGSSQVQNCKEIVRLAQEAAGKLMKDAASAGVKDIIYFFVPHVPGNNGGYVEITDYSEAPAKQQCDGMLATTGGKLACHFVDLTQPFAAVGGERNPANFWSDGLHPSSAGQSIIATQIANTMKAECLGQPASSGCCEP